MYCYYRPPHPCRCRFGRICGGSFLTSGKSHATGVPELSLESREKSSSTDKKRRGHRISEKVSLCDYGCFPPPARGYSSASRRPVAPCRRVRTVSRSHDNSIRLHLASLGVATYPHHDQQYSFHCAGIVLAQVWIQDDSTLRLKFCYLILVDI